MSRNQRKSGIKLIINNRITGRRKRMSIRKKLAQSSLKSFCNQTMICKMPCRNKKPFKILTRDAKVICPYSFELKNIIITEQLELFSDTDD